MSTSGFWDNVLEQDEKLLWAGRPKPLTHWRNWRLFGPAPMAALGLLAAWFIIATYGVGQDMWLLLLPAALIAIPARATWQQLHAYAATRYALTDSRVLFFRVDGDKTRVKAYPRSATTTPIRQNTAPPSVSFVRQGDESKAKFGFDYIDDAAALIQHLGKPA